MRHKLNPKANESLLSLIKTKNSEILMCKNYLKKIFAETDKTETPQSVD